MLKKLLEKALKSKLKALDKLNAEIAQIKQTLEGLNDVS